MPCARVTPRGNNTKALPVAEPRSEPDSSPWRQTTKQIPNLSAGVRPKLVSKLRRLSYMA
eukprot:5881179-Alexandrium_andersonii.AAC.1